MILANEKAKHIYSFTAYFPGPKRLFAFFVQKDTSLLVMRLPCQLKKTPRIFQLCVLPLPLRKHPRKEVIVHDYHQSQRRRND